MLLSEEVRRLGHPLLSVTQHEGFEVVLHPAEGAYFKLVPVDPTNPKSDQRLEEYKGPVPPLDKFDNPLRTGRTKAPL